MYGAPTFNGCIYKARQIPDEFERPVWIQPEFQIRFNFDELVWTHPDPAESENFGGEFWETYPIK